MRKCFLNPIMENIICKAVKDKNTNPGALTTLSKIGSTTGDVKAIKYCHNLSNITKIVLSITITIRGWSKWSLEYDTTIQAKNDTTIAFSLIPVFQTILKTGRWFKYCLSVCFEARRTLPYSSFSVCQEAWDFRSLLDPGSLVHLHQTLMWTHFCHTY